MLKSLIVQPAKFCCKVYVDNSEHMSVILNLFWITAHLKRSEISSADFGKRNSYLPFMISNI